MSLRSFIYHNFWLKLFSLVLAALIWSVIYEPNLRSGLLPPTPTTRDYRILVDVLVPPADARVFKISPREVVVTLTGESAVLRDLSTRNVVAYVDMRDIREAPDAEYLVQYHVPPGVTVLDRERQAVKVERISP